MDKSGDSKWGELINRHEISSACPRVDAETIAKTGETLSNSQSTGGGGKAQEYVKTKWDVLIETNRPKTLVLWLITTRWINESLWLYYCIYFARIQSSFQVRTSVRRGRGQELLKSVTDFCIHLSHQWWLK